MTKGFTLIEVLVTVSILMILISGGVASYNAMNDKAKAELVANQIMAELESLQKQASSGSSVSVSTCNPFRGIVVSYDGTSRKIKAETLCNNTLSTARYVPESGLDKDVTVSFVGVPYVIFRTLGKGVAEYVSGSGVGNQIGDHVYFQVVRGTNTYRVNLNAAGGLSVTKN